MKRIALALVALMAATGTAHAQATVYRCPGPPVVYTDALTPDEAKANNCTAIEGAPTTVCGLRNRKTGKIDNPCPTIDVDKMIEGIRAGNPPPPPWQPKELSALERWRFERCQDDATKAPTEAGVRTQLRLCRERFGQQQPSYLP